MNTSIDSGSASRAQIWLPGLVVPLLTAIHLQAMNGLEGTFEFACDAPWRIEPSRKADGSIEYGAIPIQISIHDAREAKADNIWFHPFFSTGGPRLIEAVPLPSELVSIGRFRYLRIRQVDPPTSGPGDIYELASLFEIEMAAGAWTWPAAPSEPAFAPEYRLCRRWAGEDPEPFRDLRPSSEWHASFWYPPRNSAPGTVITLEIEVLLERDPWPRVHGPLSGQEIDIGVSAPNVTLRNYVRVYLAPDPLPRFDRRWLYGDFHYHAQGTDNEGEAAYNYRGVIRAMGAMGMDFLFATEHASNSEQLMDADLHINLLEELFGEIGGDIDGLEESDADQTWGVLRDMNVPRHRFCHDLIYGTRGANSQASLQGFAQRFPQNYLSHGVVPQIFLGGEIDAIPEVNLSAMGPPPPPPPGPPPPANDTSAYWQWLQRKEAYEAWRPYGFVYGNGRVYDLAKIRRPGNEPLATLYETAGDALLVRDFQGLDTYDLYGREHLVYFPASSQLVLETNIVTTYDYPDYYEDHPDELPDEGLPPGTVIIREEVYETSFIPSGTSKFGGATRRLDADHQGKRALLPEIEKKGVAFVAHHLNASEGSRGPDGVPWTIEHMLLKVFRSPAILGLEFWNEDTRFQSRVCSHLYCRDDAFLGQEIGFERDEYFALLGQQPAELTDVPLALPEVRQGFVTGGSSGSQFELRAFSLPDGRWESPSRGTENTLHHGAYDWDRLNLMGLDLGGLANLDWLPDGQPRRVFMGGGSDAHGDLNFRRSGYFLGAEDANDTALGKPRNLVFAGEPEGAVLFDLDPPIDPRNGATGSAGRAGIRPPRPIDPPVIGGVIRAHSQEQIIRALRAGRFSVTDGPAIRMAIDMNSNNRIDETDVQMGDVYSFRKLPSNRVTRQMLAVLVECLSTAEFGPVTKVDLYVGVHPNLRGGGREPRVYAAADHGVRDPSRAPSSHPVFTYISQNQAYSRMEDGYWLDSRLVTSPPPGNPFAFTLSITLDLNHYEAGQGISADRFFVRAFAQTGADIAAQQPSRYAFTNPIWLLRDDFYVNDLPAVVTPLRPLAPRPAVAAKRTAAGRLVLEFVGTLQHTPRLDRPFEDLPGASSPHVVPANASGRFFRAR